MPRSDRSFARHLISWYAGVHAEAVAEAEGTGVDVVRKIRASMGRGTEYGLRGNDTILGRPPGAAPGQQLLAECFRNETRIG